MSETGYALMALVIWNTAVFGGLDKSKAIRGRRRVSEKFTVINRQPSRNRGVYICEAVNHTP